MQINCKTCGKFTKHFFNENEYTCSHCGGVINYMIIPGVNVVEVSYINQLEILRQTALKVNKKELAGLIIQTSYEYFGLEQTKGIDKCRDEDCRTARKISYFLIKNILDIKPKIIGEYFTKDRVTVISGIKSAKNLLETDKTFKKNLTEILNKINYEIKHQLRPGHYGLDGI
jgi:hypothetical protein